MQGNSIVSTSTASASCLELVGRTRSQTLRSSSSLECPGPSSSYDRSVFVSSIVVVVAAAAAVVVVVVVMVVVLVGGVVVVVVIISGLK
ncbi:hypothetical protein ElyMa_005705100 [Elysia marginata]|uniref:Transmembrane protein n=1 Tax=Elysia marginata TaxID=1093978 RepID=A0AAV4FI42_9GAST|nr:hypothetical protein ElyMa_005705100 [Elysia marginata]